MNDFIAQLVAQVIERAFKNYVTTIIGIGTGLTTILATIGALPIKHASYAVIASAAIAAVTAVLAKDSAK